MSLLEIGNLDEVKAPEVVPAGTFSGVLNLATIEFKNSEGRWEETPAYIVGETPHRLSLHYVFENNGDERVDGREVMENFYLPRTDHFDSITKSGITKADFMLGMLKDRLIKLGVPWSAEGVETSKLEGRKVRVVVVHKRMQVRNAETGIYEDDPDPERVYAAVEGASKA